MSQSRILLRALPNVEFVHGYPGIPTGPERPQATIRGTIEVRLGNQPVKTKWIKVDFRKVETIPSGSNGEEFIDFVGQSPMTVWQAQEEDETLTTKDLPFNIRVPETIPPSVALGRGAGIKYEVVATLCMKGKKGLFRREASTTISHAVPVVIDKHELHSTWPVYAQPESRQVMSDGLTLIVNRSNTCFAPADHLGVIATVKSDNLSPVVLRAFEFSLRETIVYRAGPQSHGRKNGPQIHTSVLGEQKVPVQMTLYGGTQHKVELGCMVPANHTTSSVNAARHIDIGYTINVKAILDKAKPIVMDLPVTITNWPRHVSSEMIRRIGTAPNLSLTPPGGHGPLPVGQAPEFRLVHSSPKAPPMGGLPNIPGSGDHQMISSSSPLVGNVNGSIPYIPGIHGLAGQVTQQPLSPGVQQAFISAQSHPGGQFGPVGSAGSEKSTFSSSDLAVLKPYGGAATEFGSRRVGNVPFSSTSPSHQGAYDSGVIDVKRRSDSIRSPPVSAHQLPGSEPYYAQSDTRPNVASPSSSLRRPRAMSRTLQIVNATDDVPEEESPVKGTKQNILHDNTHSSQQERQSVSPPTTMHPSDMSWPKAEDEKQRLFNMAKARVEKVQAQVRGNAVAGSSVQINPSHPDGRHSPSSFEQPATEKSLTASPSSPRPSWPKAEDEKRRLFEQAQANVRRTHAIAHTTPSPSTNNSVARSTHHRTASTNSSIDSGKRPYVTTSPPTISAGAALYSHAIASMKSPGMTSSNHTHAQTSSLSTRMPPSQTASSSDTSSSVKYLTAEEEKSAIRYREARMAVERRLQEEETPQESPIAYDALFPAQRSNASSPTSSGAHAYPLSEKEALRRAFEARDAALAANQPPTQAANPYAMANEVQTLSQPPPRSPEPLSEKEVLRRAFEARDAAMIRSGQIPHPAASSLRSTSPQSMGWANGSTSSHTGSKENAPPWEGEQMQTAPENRDQVTITQQAQLPPVYNTPSPTGSGALHPFSPPGFAGGAPLTAAEEKARLKARYAEEDVDFDSLTNAATTPVYNDPPSFSVDISHKSETSESYLRRDPTITAGKKRASQMITPPPPPPLLPRPPAEYIEETKLEDMKNNLSPTVALPADFSAPMDLGFSPFGSEHNTNSSTSILSEPRSG